jgi:hypothetical protein
MSTERPTGSLIDYERTACLCDVGQPDYWAAVCVTASGEDVLWLVSKDELSADHPRCGSADQPHEQLGRLPQHVAHRLHARPVHRCGRPTKTTGRPCRIEVTRPGEPCGLHRRQADRSDTASR